MQAHDGTFQSKQVNVLFVNSCYLRFKELREEANSLTLMYGIIYQHTEGVADSQIPPLRPELPDGGREIGGVKVRTDWQARQS